MTSPLHALAIAALIWALPAQPKGPTKSDKGQTLAALMQLHQEGLKRLTNGDPSDDAYGFSLVLQAAQAGLAAAQYDVAISYETGNGVAQSFEKEVEWLARAAAQSMPDAEYKLATCYRTGRGVTADPAKAFYWYRRAAEQGDAEAQFNVGTAYVRGDGIEKNMTEAVRWYERAFASGYLRAGKSLIVSRVTVDPPDYVEAEKWVLILDTRRADLTDPIWNDLDRARAEIERHLAPDLQKRAEALATEWIRRHGTPTPWRPKEVRPGSPR